MKIVGIAALSLSGLAAIAVARSFLKQGMNRESLSRRLKESSHSDPP